jgi:hypothetical protein
MQRPRTGGDELVVAVLADQDVEPAAFEDVVPRVAPQHVVLRGADHSLNADGLRRAGDHAVRQVHHDAGGAAAVVEHVNGGLAGQRDALAAPPPPFTLPLRLPRPNRKVSAAVPASRRRAKRLRSSGLISCA